MINKTTVALTLIAVLVLSLAGFLQLVETPPNLPQEKLPVYLIAEKVQGEDFLFESNTFFGERERYCGIHSYQDDEVDFEGITLNYETLTEAAIEQFNGMAREACIFHGVPVVQARYKDRILAFFKER